MIISQARCARYCIRTLLLLSLLLLLACKQSAPAATVLDANQNNPQTPVVTDTRYVCPMHAHIQQHGPGKCPICGMTLVKKTLTPEQAPPALDMPAEAGKKILYWYDPMRPEQHFDKPGPSPFMDMPLVAKYTETQANASHSNSIAVNATVVQHLGIRIASPVRRDVQIRIRVPARVVADARGQARLQSRVSGWVEKLYVRAVGQNVSAGMVVAEIYSPELLQAQEELLLNAELSAGAAERLRRMGIADSDIQTIRRQGKASRRLPLRAPASGVVTELNVREGSSVSPEAMIMDISAHNAVWVEAQLFPVQKMQLGNTMHAAFSLPGMADSQWSANNGNAVPVLDPITQTMAVRFSLNNAAELPLGTALDAELSGAIKTGVLLVPASAVIRTAQGNRVIVVQANKQFVPTKVMLGQRYGDEFEIIDGISMDDRVVVSGQFLLDAEADLQAGLSQMSGTANNNAASSAGATQ